MIILKLLMCILLFLIIPEILGMIITKFLKKEEKFFLNFICGFVLQFAILELIAIPMIFLKLKFSILASTWITLVSILSIVSFVINIKNIKNIIINILKEVKKLPLLTILVILLVGFQTFMLVRYAHIDDDDAFYVATATVTVQKNTMYLSCAEDGGYYGSLPSRYVLSPFPMYTAIISHFTQIHPAIVAHTLFPLIFIPLAYVSYGVIASKFFNKDKKSIMLFLSILSVMYIWGNYSIRSNFTFLLFRIWQGKAILANILLPLSWYAYLECVENNKFINWLFLFIISLASCLVSSMGIFLIPISTVIMSFIFTIKDKKISYLMKSFFTIIPCLIYGIIYLLIK